MQVVVLPIAERHYSYALEVKQQIAQAQVRVELNDENATLGAKLRKAQLQKIPYILIVGDKEVENHQVSVRDRKEGDLDGFSLQDFLLRIQNEIQNFIM